MYWLNRLQVWEKVDFYVGDFAEQGPENTEYFDELDILVPVKIKMNPEKQKTERNHCSWQALMMEEALERSRRRRGSG